MLVPQVKGWYFYWINPQPWSCVSPRNVLMIMDTALWAHGHNLVNDFMTARGGPWAPCPSSWSPINSSLSFLFHFFRRPGTSYRSLAMKCLPVKVRESKKWNHCQGSLSWNHFFVKFINCRTELLLLFLHFELMDPSGSKSPVNSPSNSDFIWRRFYGKESSPLEAIRELG